MNKLNVRTERPTKIYGVYVKSNQMRMNQEEDDDNEQKSEREQKSNEQHTRNNT